MIIFQQSSFLGYYFFNNTFASLKIRSNCPIYNSIHISSFFILSCLADELSNACATVFLYFFSPL